MRKILFVLLILLLCGIGYFVFWYDIPSLDVVKTYMEVEDAYGEYYNSLETLEAKNDNELPSVKAKLNPEYSNSDTDNVIKKYNDNKKYYEELVALQKATTTIDSADIYDIEYIWTALGKHCDGIDITMNVIKSDADLNSNDYIMCNLDFSLVGRYGNIAEFIDEVELDSSLGFQINDFFVEGYNKTARNQSKDSNMDTNNIPSSEISDENSDSYTGLTYSVGSTLDPSDKHALDVVASFKVYNIPLNKKTVTNIQDPAVSTNLTTDTNTELTDDTASLDVEN